MNKPTYRKAAKKLLGEFPELDKATQKLVLTLAKEMDETREWVRDCLEEAEQEFRCIESHLGRLSVGIVDYNEISLVRCLVLNEQLSRIRGLRESFYSVLNWVYGEDATRIFTAICAGDTY